MGAFDGCANAHSRYSSGTGGCGEVPFCVPISAAVAELADALDSGSSGSKIPWRFDSSQPHFSIGQGMFLMLA